MTSFAGLVSVSAYTPLSLSSTSLPSAIVKVIVSSFAYPFGAVVSVSVYVPSGSPLMTVFVVPDLNEMPFPEYAVLATASSP